MRHGRVNLFVMLLAFVIATPSLSAQGRNRPTAPSLKRFHFSQGPKRFTKTVKSMSSNHTHDVTPQAWRVSFKLPMA
jgi:hypothetical protein